MIEAGLASRFEAIDDTEGGNTLYTRHTIFLRGKITVNFYLMD